MGLTEGFLDQDLSKQRKTLISLKRRVILQSELSREISERSRDHDIYSQLDSTAAAPLCYLYSVEHSCFMLYAQSRSTVTSAWCMIFSDVVQYATG